MSKTFLQLTKEQSPNPILHILSTYTFTNVQIIPPSPSITSTYNAIPPFTIHPSTKSNPANINSSASISEPFNPIDGLDHNYTPEQYLQHMRHGLRSA